MLIPNSFYDYLDSLIYSSFMLENFVPLFYQIREFLFYAMMFALIGFSMHIMSNNKKNKPLILYLCILLLPLGTLIVYGRMAQIHDEKYCKSLGLENYECSLQMSEEGKKLNLLVVLNKSKMIKNVYQMEERRFLPTERPEREYLFVALEVSQIREIRLYPKGDDYVAKVEILMKDKDSPLENLEHYTLDITKKDGKYYVKNMTNSIGG